MIKVRSGSPKRKNQPESRIDGPHGLFVEPSDPLEKKRLVQSYDLRNVHDGSFWEPALRHRQLGFPELSPA